MRKAPATFCLLPCDVSSSWPIGEATGIPVAIPQGSKLLGRGGETNIADSRVSREHVEVSVEEDGRCWVKAIGKNQIFVNGKPVSNSHSFELLLGDKVSFVKNLFTYQLVNSLPESTKEEAQPAEKETKPKRPLSPSLSSGDEELLLLQKEQDEMVEAKRRKKADEEAQSVALAFHLQEEEEKKMKEAIALFERKKSATEFIPLPHGVILFKSCLSIDEQIGILNIVSELHSEMRKTKSNVYATAEISRPARGQVHPAHWILYNWYKGSAETVRPSDLIDFGKRMFDRAYKYAKESGLLSEDLPEHFKCPSSYKPESLIGLLYPSEGKLMGHFDGVDGWVLSMSMGNSCMFSIADSQKGEKTQVKLDSGDLVLFNGNKVWHEVERIVPNTAPKFWRENLIDTKGYARFNLQFRQQQK